jgi:broad specificity phosphatase PhoE
MRDRSATELLIVRHPETVSNSEHRYVGRGDSPLTERGREQHGQLVVAVGAWQPERVYSSPIERALSVANKVSGCGVPLVVSDALAEVDFGCAEGMTYQEMRSRGLRVDHPGLVGDQAGILCGESWSAFYERVGAVAAKLQREPGRTAVFTHGGVVRALLAALLDMPREVAWKLRVDNATAARVTIDEGYASLRALGLPPSGILP